MKKYFLMLTALFMQISFAQPAEDLNLLLSRYQTYQADFQQVVFDDSKQVVQRSQGQIYLMRPGKFRWETVTPTPQTIVSDGTTLWIYDPGLSQVTRQRLSFQSGANPAILLSGRAGTLLKRFKIYPSISDDYTDYQLVPQFQASIQSLQMRFSNGVLSRIIVVNNLGQSSVFNFSNMRINIPLDPNLFRLHVPQGTQIITQ